MFTSVEYLARQALPFRGHTEERGNFHQLMVLRGNESADLKSWIACTRPYMSHEIQNEMLQVMGHQILRAIMKDVSSSNWFALIADEATDASLVEQVKCACVCVCVCVCVLFCESKFNVTNFVQLSICLRYVDPQTLQVHEDCIGLYATDRTDASTIAKLILDLLV